jgi:uncharacterized HAD superfamily protein
MTVAVVDIDGVVADVRHRLHHLSSRPKDWDGFFADAAADPPLPTGILVVHELASVHDIVWLTGRPARLQAVTRRWLRAHDLPDAELHMRSSRDRRPARIYKLEVLHALTGRKVGAFVDDDDEVVRAARAAGFPALLADWVPRAGELRRAQDDAGRT